MKSMKTQNTTSNDRIRRNTREALWLGVRTVIMLGAAIILTWLIYVSSAWTYVEVAGWQYSQHGLPNMAHYFMPDLTNPLRMYTLDPLPTVATLLVYLLLIRVVKRVRSRLKARSHATS